jgi:DNA repair exonuclease SbcCD ATPase subunit
VDLDSVTEELYALPPAEFVAGRNTRSKEARAAGDRGLAAAIQALRKPTVAAWAVNQLMREHPDDVRVLLDLGQELRSAQSALAGAELRSLTHRRYELVAGLTSQARTLAADRGQRISEEAAGAIRSTLEATLIDPANAEAVQAARLSDPLQASGFGFEFGGFGAAGTVDSPTATGGPAGADVADLDAHRERRVAELERAKADLQRVETALEHARALRQDADEQLRSVERRRAAAADAMEQLRRQLDRATADHDKLAATADKRRDKRDRAAETVSELESDASQARDAVRRLSRSADH